MGAPDVLDVIDALVAHSGSVEEARALVAPLFVSPDLLRDLTAGPLLALQLAEVFEATLDPDQQAAIAARIVEVVPGLPVRQRLEQAERAHLPLSARRLGAHAAPVLRWLIEDAPMRPFFADTAARLWLELDLDDALPSALGVASEVGSATLLNLVTAVDPEEGFELLAARFDSDLFFAELLCSTRVPIGEDRWVPKAMTQMATRPRLGVRLLKCVGTPRAIDELIGIFEHSPDDAAEGLEAFSACCGLPGTPMAFFAAVLARADAATLVRRLSGQNVFLQRYDELQAHLALHPDEQATEALARFAAADRWWAAQRQQMAGVGAGDSSEWELE